MPNNDIIVHSLPNVFSQKRIVGSAPALSRVSDIIAQNLSLRQMESVRVYITDKKGLCETLLVQEKDWATNGTMNHPGRRNVANSLHLDPYGLEQHNIHLQEKYKLIKKNETAFELVNMKDAEYVIVAYGTMARICRSAIEMLNEKGIKVGMIRPITLWPFPEAAFDEISEKAKGILCCELSMGQMIDDVLIANNGRHKVGFFGRSGGVLPDPEEIVDAIVNFKDKVVK